jgi:signal transduction histidine kinase/phage shock protein PspC (stress-responsive transcriptional regulator)
MTPAMSATTSARPALRRDPARGVVAGVAAGLAERAGLDPLIVRVAFVIAAFGGGAGIVLYLIAWALMPAGESEAGPAARLRTGRGALEVALGAGLLLLALLLTLRALGIWFSDLVVWPAFLLASGAALLWRQSFAGGALRQDQEPPAAALGHPAPQPPPAADDAGRRARAISRTGLGVALVLAAGLVFLEAAGALGAARDVLLAVVAAIVVLGVIFAPWVLRLVRSLADERTARVRSQERAEVAAHLHDSVLQTLALIQKRSDDPRAVATLARRQERELRAWLSGRAAAASGAARLGAALEAAADEVERDHGVAVEVVAVGDADLDERGEALVAAAREAMVNAAKFGGGAPVDVYAEAGPDGRVLVFVRDRGPGFDLGAVPPDRRGVRESIVARMERHGGQARIRSDAGQGTEVELELEPRR